jgi:phosphatidylserine synthase
VNRVELGRNVLRLAFATIAVVAMTYQFARLNVDPDYAKGNFFSFFTIQANILAFVALCLLVAVPRPARTPLFDAARSGAVLYIGITGVVFALLLAGLQEELQTTIPWVDFVVHKLMPVVVVVDWLLDPPRDRLPLVTGLAWLVYPAAWLVYTLVRGEIVDWYPYPFVDVDRHGYGRVLLNGVVLAVGMALAALALAWLGNRRTRGLD